MLSSMTWPYPISHPLALWRFSSPLWTWWCAEENSVRKPGAYLLLAYSRSQRLRMLTAVMRRSSMRGSSQRRSSGRFSFSS